MPSKPFEKSAEVPPGPVMCTARPWPLSPTFARMESTAGAMRCQPEAFMVTGTVIWAARGATRRSKTGPRVCVPRTPCARSVRSSAASCAIFARSAAVSPLARA